MTPPGHLAAAYLVSRRDPGRRLRRLVPIGFGALFPDLLDKPIMWLGISVYGRTVGHSLLLWAAALLAAMLAARLRLPRAEDVWLFAVGGLSHLAADLIDGAAQAFEHSSYLFSAWAGWPVTNPDMWQVRVTPAFASAPFVVSSVEAITLALAVVLSVHDHRADAVRAAR